MAFWQNDWEVVQEDVIGVLREFYVLGRFKRSLNAIFIVLVSNKGSVWRVKDFEHE